MPGQIVEVIDPAARDRRLEELLRKYHASRKNRVLVFVLYKKEAARVEGQLSKRGWNVRTPGIRLHVSAPTHDFGQCCPHKCRLVSSWRGAWASLKAAGILAVSANALRMSLRPPMTLAVLSSQL